LEEFLATADPNVDPEDGHPMAYTKILEEAQKFETAPRFIKEDSEAIANDPVLSANVPEWMAKAQQVATGSHKRVLENGRDVVKSSDEDDEDMKPDALHDMYTAEMDPKAGPKVLSQAQAAYQRVVGRAKASLEQTRLKAEAALKPTSTTLTPTDPDDDWSWMSEDQRRKAEIAAQKLAENPVIVFKPPPRSPSSPDIEAPPKKSAEPTVQAPAKGAPLDIKKAAASPRAPADQPTGAKAPTPTKRQAKGQESPETKVSTPMRTRSQAKQQEGSRAGGFRPGVGGSGQTDTCVASSHPSKT
jgi:hypothetical protein